MSTPPPSDALDEALALLQRSGPEYGGGLANHAPMAAEALVVLGRDDDVLPWVRSYARRLDPLPAPWKPIDVAHWRASLGEERHAADWPAFFARELRERPWNEVLDAWVARLAPGLAAAAAHGVLRTAHAARALAARDTPERRAELCAGLGYWAMTYQALPQPRVPRASSATGAPRALTDVLGALPNVPGTRRRDGLISDGLRALDDFPEFAEAAEAAPLDGPLEAVLSQACLAFARAYLSDQGRELFPFIHAVTGPSAVRLLAPHLSPATARAALREAWRVGAGLYAVFGSLPPRPATGEPPQPAALIEAALATGDEHAIKLTEACLREHAALGEADFLHAAADVSRRFARR